MGGRVGGQKRGEGTKGATSLKIAIVAGAYGMGYPNG
jgi:hypothetical protein